MKDSLQSKSIQQLRKLAVGYAKKAKKLQQQVQILQAKCKQYEDELGRSAVKLTSKQQLDFTITKGPIEEINQNVLNTLKGKWLVMHKFLKAVKIFGITPEAIYRIADVFYTNCIESDYFRTILSKMVLQLTPKEVSSLIFIFDENCLGYISKQDYDNSLHAYEVAVEEKSLPYTQQCLLRFCGLLYAERIDINKFYDEMKELAKTRNSKGDVDLIVFQEHTNKYFAEKLQERQIVGAFNQINLEKQKSIEKKNFLYGVNSFTNRLLSDQRPGIQVLSPSQIQLPSQIQASQTTQISMNNLKNSRSHLKIANVNNQSTISVMKRGGQRFDQPEQNPLDKLLKDKNVQFQDIALQMIQLPMKSRLTIHQFKKCFFKMLVQFTTEDIAVIFRAMDTRQQGSFDIFDAINFSLTHFKDVHLVMMLIGKSLQCTSTSPEEFWNSEQFEDFSRAVTKARFIQIMAGSCKTSNPQSWEVIWNFFDKGKGTISVQSIIDVWKKYHMEQIV